MYPSVPPNVTPLPFVGCHHLEEHLLMATMPPTNGNGQPAKFPFLALLVSGGHCQLIKCRDVCDYEVVGGTIDDSLGECYDKVARMLGVDLGDMETTQGKRVGSGGEAIEIMAREVEGGEGVKKMAMKVRQREDKRSENRLANRKRLAKKTSDAEKVQRNEKRLAQKPRKKKNFHKTYTNFLPPLCTGFPPQCPDAKSEGPRFFLRRSEEQFPSDER